MAYTVKIAPDLYTNPPKTGIPGARWDYREISLLTTDLITTQIVALGILPAGHRLMDFFVESAALDSGTTTITLTVGILNTYYNQALPTATVPAAYNSGGTTETSTTSVLTTGQNLLTAATTAVRVGGRADKLGTLNFAMSVGIDTTRDRIVALYFPAAPATATAGKLGLGLCIDEP